MTFSSELRSQLLTPQLAWFAVGNYWGISYHEANSLTVEPWWIGIKVVLKGDFIDPKQGFSKIVSYQKLAYAIEDFFNFRSSNCGIVSRNGNLATVRGSQGDYRCTTGAAGHTCNCKLYRCMNNRLVKGGESPQLLKALKRTELWKTHNGKPQILCHHLLALK